MCGIAGFIVNFVEDYLTITILSGLFIVGGVGVTILNTAVVDLFPTQYRSIAMAVSLMAGRGGAMVSSPFISYLLEYSCIAVYYIIGAKFISTYIEHFIYNIHFLHIFIFVFSFGYCVSTSTDALKY